jgi:hypothetical protein
MENDRFKSICTNQQRTNTIIFKRFGYRNMKTLVATSMKTQETSSPFFISIIIKIKIEYLTSTVVR